MGTFGQALRGETRNVQLKVSRKYYKQKNYAFPVATRKSKVTRQQGRFPQP
jgi:hypothetical protein